MSSFKPKRVSGSDLARQLADATVGLPTQTPSSTDSTAVIPTIKSRPPPVVQVNFKASEAFANLIAREAERAGSTRRLFARLMREAGHEVPEADVAPPDNRRRRV